jgi:prolyl oligopeptidase
MTWVTTENGKSAAVLERDPRFAGRYAAALKMAQAQDRLADATFTAGAMYNFWPDAAQVRREDGRSETMDKGVTTVP